VTTCATMMAGRQTSFVEMLLDRLCRFNVSILTNNYALTFVHTSNLGLCNFRIHKHHFLRQDNVGDIKSRSYKA
jgi:hypothetical protein